MFQVTGPALPLWAFLLADDWELPARGPNLARTLLIAIWAMVVFKVPISWKMPGGRIFNWVGYELNLEESSLGISERRATWLCGWFTQVLSSGSVVIREFLAGLGRMVFLYGALEYDRPCLAPSFTFAHVQPLESTAKVPLYVRMVVPWLLTKLQARRACNCQSSVAPEKGSFRVDAKAEGLKVALGGWLPKFDGDGLTDTMASQWFSVELDPVFAPLGILQGFAVP